MAQRHTSLNVNSQSALLLCSSPVSFGVRQLSSRSTRQSCCCRRRHCDACMPPPPPAWRNARHCRLEIRSAPTDDTHATNVTEQCARRHGSRGHLAESLVARHGVVAAQQNAECGRQRSPINTLRLLACMPTLALKTIAAIVEAQKSATSRPGQLLFKHAGM